MRYSGRWLGLPRSPRPAADRDDRQLVLPFAAHVKSTVVQLVDIREPPYKKVLFSLTASQLEELVFERLRAMGLHPQTVGGGTYRRDGGIDIIFTPPKDFAFPFIGAVQVKHHRDPRAKVGPAPLRELLGVISANRFFAAGMIVTNTSFTPDARDFAARSQSLLRLRDFYDLMNWVADNFTDDARWSEIPQQIQLCDGILVKIR